MADFKYILEHNAVAAIHHADAMVDRGEITFGEYEEMIKPWTDAEPVKHGHWIVLHGVLAGDDIYGDMGECSNCGLHLRNWEWNYCPNCGAKMDEEVQE